MSHPYDTGERAQPHDWMQVRADAGETIDRSDMGKVDFDNDSGETVATVWVERDSLGRYSVRVERYDDTTQIRTEG